MSICAQNAFTGIHLQVYLYFIVDIQGAGVPTVIAAIGASVNSYVFQSVFCFITRANSLSDMSVIAMIVIYTHTRNLNA